MAAAMIIIYILYVYCLKYLKYCITQLIVILIFHSIVGRNDCFGHILQKNYISIMAAVI